MYQKAKCKKCSTVIISAPLSSLSCTCVIRRSRTDSQSRARTIANRQALTGRAGMGQAERKWCICPHRANGGELKEKLAVSAAEGEHF